MRVTSMSFPQGITPALKRRFKLIRLRRKNMLPSKADLADMVANAIATKPITKLPDAPPDATLGWLAGPRPLFRTTQYPKRQRRR
jgi:hypothetical protein